MDRKKIVIFYYGNDDFRYGVAEVFQTVLLKVDCKKYHKILVYSGTLSEDAIVRLSDIDLYQLKQNSLKKCVIPLYKLLLKLRPEILMTGTEHANIICALIKLVTWRGMRLIVSVHSPLTQRFQEMWSKSEARNIRWLIFLFYRVADKVVCVSNYVKHDVDYYARSGNSTVIYNPVSVNEDNNITDRDFSHIDLLVVSRLVENKCIEDVLCLIERTRLIRKLIIVGDGPCRSNLENLSRTKKIEDRVVFHGYVVHPENYYRIADVLVLPSRWEGFGNVLIEAMSYGCQVIVNRNAGAPLELINYGEYGFTYEQGNIKSLQKAFDSCRQRPVPAKKLFNYARRFNIGSAISSYEQLFNAVTDE